MEVKFASILSISEFDCLDFHDGRSLSLQEKINVAQCLRKIISLMLDNLGYKHHSRPIDKVLRQRLQAWSDERLLPMFPGKSQVLQEILNGAAQSSEYFYTACQHETRFVTAIMTTILMASDDDIILDSEERESLCHFSFNHWQNLPQTNKWCKILAEGMRMCAEYFGSQDPLVGSFSGRSFSSFIDACAQEYRLEHELPVHIGNHGLSHPSSEGCSVELFPAYFRGSSGASLAYTVPIFKVSRDEEVPLCVWITAIPDIMKFINFVNDLLSCPKEILTGEAWNYMTLQTQVKRQAGRLTKYSSKHNKLWTFRDTVCEMLEELQRTTLALDHAFTKCIRTGIDDCPIGTNDMSSSTQDWKNKIDQNIESAAHLWMSFKYGYISLHLNSSRYGLEPIAFGG